MLVVGIYDDPALSDAIRREWVATTGQEIDCQNRSLEELNQSSPIKADVLILPVESLGNLAERKLIRPIPESANAKLNLPDVVPTARYEDVYFGKQRFGVSLGSPQLTLFLPARYPSTA